METQTEIDLKNYAKQDAQSCDSDIRGLFEASYFEISKNEYQDNRMQSIKLLEFASFTEEACKEINLTSPEIQERQRAREAIKQLLLHQDKIDERTLRLNQILTQNAKNHQQEESSDSLLNVSDNRGNATQLLLRQILKEYEDETPGEDSAQNTAYLISNFLQYARESVKKEQSFFSFFKKTKIELQINFLKNFKSFQKRTKEEQERITQYFSLHFEQENDANLGFNVDFYLETKEAFKFKKKEQDSLRSMQKNNQPVEIKLITRDTQRQEEKAFEPLEIKLLTRDTQRQEEKAFEPLEFKPIAKKEESQRKSI